jgi:hypothetical protein
MSLKPAAVVIYPAFRYILLPAGTEGNETHVRELLLLPYSCGWGRRPVIASGDQLPVGCHCVCGVL